MKRKAISQKVRFEVFKRDSFKCQYCGRPAPDVILRCDHLNPVKNGGDNNIANLITSCFDCNSGKGATRLDDNALIKKTYAQIAELNEKRRQLEMMMKWRAGLVSATNSETESVVSHLKLIAPGFTPNDTGKRHLSRWIKKYGIENVLNSAEQSFEKYDGTTSESWGNSFNKIPNFCSFNIACAGNPAMREYFYIRGILKNRFRVAGWMLPEVLATAKTIVESVGFDEAKKIATQCNSLREFEEAVAAMVEGQNA